jgi:hypothetical protein
MVCPSVEEEKSDEVSVSEENAQEIGGEKMFFEGKVLENEELESPKTERLAVGRAQDMEALSATEKEFGEEMNPSVVGSKAQGEEDLFEKAVKDEGVRLRIIGEYLSSLGKANAPLTAVGGGSLAAPLMKAKTVGEAGNMALLYFRKPNL